MPNRNARKHPVKSKTEVLAKRHLQLVHPPRPTNLPATRGECLGGPRPCPLVSCRHNLYLDVQKRTGNLKINFPDREPEDMPPHESCALDVADEGGATLERVGALANVTRARIQQREADALRRRHVREAMEDLDPIGAQADPWDSYRAETGGTSTDQGDDAWRSGPLRSGDVEVLFRERVWLRYEMESRLKYGGRLPDGRPMPETVDQAETDAWADRVMEGLLAGRKLREAIDVASKEES